MREMKLQELKAKTPAELVSFAEELAPAAGSTMRKPNSPEYVLRVRPDPFMFHCHILEHEEAGLMGQYVCA
jgi:FtsP/CotA-like multicopper oxidase with cupredoxin domain